MDNKKGNRSPLGDNNGNRNSGQSILIVFICIVVSLLSMAAFSGAFNESASRKITYDEFIRMLDEGNVKSVVINTDTVDITPKADQNSQMIVKYYTTRTEDITALTERLDKANVTFSRKETSVALEIVETVLSFLIPFVFFLFFMTFLMNRMNKGGGVMSVGRNRAKTYVQKNTGVTFKDVAGEDEAKESLQEVVEFLHNPGRYIEIGAKLPKGALLVGPPGTGKTLLAKAVAGEANVPFFSLSGSEFVEMFVGVGASRVRDLFEEAKKNAPCIIFIDEIDAVGRSRSNTGSFGGRHDEQTINALLVEMDGFETSEGVILVAATNRPDVLDKALLRPGRFDRQIVIDLPTLEGRKEILALHASKLKMAEGVDLERIARGTPGFSGADLANLLNEAALLAARLGKEAVELSDLEEARDKVAWGRERRGRMADAEEKRLTAVHEAGHAIVMSLVKGGEPIHKVTIIPRGMALGATMFLPKKDRLSYTRTQMLANLATSMGGRVAEELFLDDISSGASQDLKEATHLAHHMVCDWGMSEKLGPRTFGARDDMVFWDDSKDYSDATAREIDAEINALIRDAHETATEILSTHKNELHVLVEELLEKETVDGTVVEEIVKFGRVLTDVERHAADAPTPPPPEAASEPKPEEPPTALA